jgi:hypothetical protein
LGLIRLLFRDSAHKIAAAVLKTKSRKYNFYFMLRRYPSQVQAQKDAIKPKFLLQFFTISPGYSLDRS